MKTSWGMTDQVKTVRIPGIELIIMLALMEKFEIRASNLRIAVDRGTAAHDSNGTLDWARTVPRVLGVLRSKIVFPFDAVGS